MTFSVLRSPRQIIDEARGWRMTGQSTMGGIFFKLEQASGAHIVFTAAEIPWRQGGSTRTDGYMTEWRITSVGHRPEREENALSRDEQRKIIGEAMAAYGHYWGEGAGPALLHFE